MWSDIQKTEKAKLKIRWIQINILPSKKKYALHLGSKTKDLLCMRQKTSFFFLFFLFFFQENNLPSLCPTTVRLWLDISEFCSANF